jgi:hypothetical protein
MKPVPCVDLGMACETVEDAEMRVRATVLCSLVDRSALPAKITVVCIPLFIPGMCASNRALASARAPAMTDAIEANLGRKPAYATSTRRDNLIGRRVG